jgi:hypothetical protein
MLSIGSRIRQGKSIRHYRIFRGQANDSGFAVAFRLPRATIVTMRYEAINHAMES